MLRFNKTYFSIALLLLAIEICIAIFARDQLIRPYVGDFFVVILLYCLLKSFLDITAWRAGILVLLLAYAVEISQYFHLVKLLGLEQVKPASIILGNTFGLGDILAYTLGIFFAVIVSPKIPSPKFRS